MPSIFGADEFDVVVAIVVDHSVDGSGLHRALIDLAQSRFILMRIKEGIASQDILEAVIDHLTRQHPTKQILKHE